MGLCSAQVGLGMGVGDDITHMVAEVACGWGLEHAWEGPIWECAFANVRPRSCRQMPVRLCGARCT